MQWYKLKEGSMLLGTELRMLYKGTLYFYYANGFHKTLILTDWLDKVSKKEAEKMLNYNKLYCYAKKLDSVLYNELLK